MPRAPVRETSRSLDQPPAIKRIFMDGIPQMRLEGAFDTFALLPRKADALAGLFRMAVTHQQVFIALAQGHALVVLDPLVSVDHEKRDGEQALGLLLRDGPGPVDVQQHALRKAWLRVSATTQLAPSWAWLPPCRTL